MEKEKVGGIKCFTCGNPVNPVRLEFTGNGLIGQCARCINVDELIEQLIRKQLRDARPARFAAAF